MEVFNCTQSAIVIDLSLLQLKYALQLLLGQCPFESGLFMDSFYQELPERDLGQNTSYSTVNIP